MAARAGPNWATNPNDAISPSACLRFTVIEASYPERAMPPVCATAVGAAALRVSQVVKEISTPSSSICTRLKAAVMPTLPLATVWFPLNAFPQRPGTGSSSAWGWPHWC